LRHSIKREGEPGHSGSERREKARACARGKLSGRERSRARWNLAVCIKENHPETEEETLSGKGGNTGRSRKMGEKGGRQNGIYSRKRKRGSAAGKNTRRRGA